MSTGQQHRLAGQEGSLGAAGVQNGGGALQPSGHHGERHEAWGASLHPRAVTGPPAHHLREQPSTHCITPSPPGCHTRVHEWWSTLCLACRAALLLRPTLAENRRHGAAHPPLRQTSLARALSSPDSSTRGCADHDAHAPAPGAGAAAGTCTPRSAVPGRGFQRSRTKPGCAVLWPPGAALGHSGTRCC